MANMSYCRFENTDRDLADCEEALMEMIEMPSDENKLSAAELDAARDLVSRCLTIVRMITDHAGLKIQKATGHDLEMAVEQLNENQVD